MSSHNWSCDKLFQTVYHFIYTHCHDSDKTCSYRKYSHLFHLHFLSVHDRRTETPTAWPTQSDLTRNMKLSRPQVRCNIREGSILIIRSPTSCSIQHWHLWDVAPSQLVNTDFRRRVMPTSSGFSSLRHSPWTAWPFR